MDTMTRLAFSVYLVVTVFFVHCSGASETKFVRNRPKQLDLQETAVINELNISGAVLAESDEGFNLNTEEDSSGQGRKKRQITTTNPLLLLLRQECEGILLRWLIGNLPLSPDFHTSNSEFSHYNIYRETTFFITVRGRQPIASGKNIAELRNLKLQKWFDKFPPTGTRLYYAVTIVNNKGEEPRLVIPKQISFVGSFENVGTNPARFMPNIIQGSVMTHSVAYNNLRNEYFVVLDVDQNSDNIPDRVYGWRTNAQGRLLDNRVIDFTLSRVASREQGHPTVAFNPSTQEYLVAWHVSASLIQGGVHMIFAQKVYDNQTKTTSHAYGLVGSRFDYGFRPVTRPNLLYNSGSGGYVMSVVVNRPPKNLATVFVKPNGRNATVMVFYAGLVLGGKLFMDTRIQQVYIVYQVPTLAINLTSGNDATHKQYPYVILLSKASATGELLKIGSAMAKRYVIGYTREANAHIDGYFERGNGWLNVFWNNRENGRYVLNSSSLVGIPGLFLQETISHNCQQHRNVKNSASCFLPTSNAHIMIWEEGARLGGYLVKNGAFNPVRGIQRSAVVTYNARQRRALVVYQQTVYGRRVLFARNIAPSSSSRCSPRCRSNERCAMKDVCAPRNSVVVNNGSTCLKDNGGCSHICKSHPNGRTCSCRQNYTQALDGMKCFLTAAKPDVSLLYSTADSIWSVSVYYAEKRASFSRLPINARRIISLFYNAKDKYIYWSDSTLRKIYKAHLNGTNKQEIINGNVIVPGGMIVDPEARRLYWADTRIGTVFRSTLDGASVVSFITGINKPRDLTLHQKNRWLFWTNWGFLAKIERINTDGSNRVVLVQSGLLMPNGLTNDGKYLYWADTLFKRIEMSNLDGSGRITLTTKGINRPYGLGIAGHRLYWTDLSGHIRSLDKRHAYQEPEVLATGTTNAFSLQIYNGTAFLNALPVFTRLPSDQTVYASKSVLIRCSSNIAPITWYKDGKVLGPSRRHFKDRITGYLLIFKVSVSDTGLYTCEAKNVAGRIHASMSLTVKPK
ncbi:uncharacterized protein LOC114525788 [Dendronephthya gigantea]|uniref:uncharacterized protein LOC114525788 n=1 Tax=Dendronephthya gigantea TaxID=151771 RepID=UPI00106AD90C|nr:uncharacterized protein LOC114525788 [Dendronephthya gigantea]